MKKNPKPKRTPLERPIQRRSASSPVYPAVKLPEPVQELKTPPPPQHTEHHQKTLRKGKVAVSWAAKAMAVLVPAILSGFSSYHVSNEDQATGFRSTSKPIEELQEAVKALATQVAYLQGQIDAARKEDAAFHGHKRLSREAPPPDAVEQVVLTKLPQSYDAVLRQKGRQMEQQVITFAEPAVFDASDTEVLNDAVKKRAAALEDVKKKRSPEQAAPPSP